MSRCVYDDKYFTVIAPVLPLNCREDGGHLILIKKEPVSDRSDLCYREAIDFMRITMIVGRAMYDVLNIERMNYEDLGNWGLDDPGGAKMHLHFFGRARAQVHQIRGQHIFLYPKDHKIYQGHLKPLNADDLRSLKARIDELVDEPKYRNYSPLPPEAARVPYQLTPVASERATQPGTIGPPLKTGAESRHTFCRRRHAGAYI